MSKALVEAATLSRIEIAFACVRTVAMAMARQKEKHRFLYPFSIANIKNQCHVFGLTWLIPRMYCYAWWKHEDLWLFAGHFSLPPTYWFLIVSSFNVNSRVISTSACWYTMLKWRPPLVLWLVSSVLLLYDKYEQELIFPYRRRLDSIAD